MAAPGWIIRLLAGNTGETINSVRGLIDETVTNKQEREELKVKAKREIDRYRLLMQAEFTTRLKSDNETGSWLTRNVRPIILIFVVCVLAVAMLFFKDFDSDILNIFKSIANTAIGFYFGGRSAEKVIGILRKKNQT